MWEKTNWVWMITRDFPFNVLWQHPDALIAFFEWSCWYCSRHSEITSCISYINFPLRNMSFLQPYTSVSIKFYEKGGTQLISSIKCESFATQEQRQQFLQVLKSQMMMFYSLKSVDYVWKPGPSLKNSQKPCSGWNSSLENWLCSWVGMSRFEMITKNHTTPKFPNLEVCSVCG